MAVTSLFKWPSFVDHVMLKIKIARGWAWICMTWRVSHSLFTWSTIYVDGDEEGAWRRCWWWWQCCCRVHCLYPFKTIFDLKGTPFISRTLKNGTLLAYLSRRISRWTEEVWSSYHLSFSIDYAWREHCFRTVLPKLASRHRRWPDATWY